MRFVNGVGVTHYGRYRISPTAGADYLDDAAANEKSPNYLFEELEERVAAGAIRLEVEVQIAAGSDRVNDTTIQWPADRRWIRFGKIELPGKAANKAAEHQHIIFDAIPRVEGIDASDDPLLELQAAVYLISVRRSEAETMAQGV